MDMRDPDFEERERLERFLKWREAAGRDRPLLDRRVLFLCVGIVLGVLADLLVGTLARSSFDKPARLATGQTRLPAKQLATPSGNGAWESAPRREAVRASIEREPSKLVEAQAAAVDPELARDPSRVKPRRSARLEPRTPRPARQPVAARELPERSPASALPRLREDLPDLGPSSRVSALPLPPRPIPAPLDQPQILSESAAGAGPSTASSPTATVVSPAVPPVLEPDLPKEVTIPKGIAAAGAPPPPQPLPAPLDAGGTPGEAAAATPLPPVAVVTPAAPPVPRADIAKNQRSETTETVKRLIGYMPEVRAGKAIYRWVKSQPPPDAGPRPSTQSPEAR